MATPGPAPCADKENLLEDLRLVNRQLAQIYAAESAAAENSDLAAFDALQPQLEEAHKYRRMIIDSLAKHLREHGC